MQKRQRRASIRAWRRGTREMDLILGSYADENLTRMTEEELRCFEALLHENDQDIYAWITGMTPPPAEYMAEIQALIANLEQTRAKIV